ncbi:methyl-accepting chemotaxis protein (plasmid) [Sphingomonas naphthae]|uniref:Methyl-accepting chemotaxis protein n=1 Tax=Sphingomonas naphthae TaxID=1813468 RepID=A0ABY7TR88_9SPHN|nr:methyl-accepting chemotaxis protein [Sphingomonas naphthae]WCT75738.1 methyl-accepting chemotaxis protein [Sphingomonas naphthae]
MLTWFTKNAPIRSKFKTLTSCYALISLGSVLALSFVGAPSAAIGIGLAGAFMITLVSIISSRLICDPYVNTVVRMEGLAAGDLDSPVLYTDHNDCVGRLTKAMDTFRLQACAAMDGKTVTHVVQILSAGLEAVAEGNLNCAIHEPFAGDYDRLRLTFNEAVERLERSLTQVASSARSVNGGSNEIKSASEDLARRTEQQAASLEETTAAMDQVTGMVAETARSAVEVRSAVNAAHQDASEGGVVVKQAVTAMDAIEKSSQEIEQIINVIDGISFQTNLLALNAGVEAARAGDAGKGFAVVANEVRALAQRSADAAKDIKSLITTSSQQVARGVSLVAETGTMLGRIATKISDINGLISEIAAGTEIQASNLHQVNGAVNDMDKMTQQNAAMVEESTAAARSLSHEADEMAMLVARFRLRGQDSGVSPHRVPTNVPRSASAVPRPMVLGNLALKEQDDWNEF